MRSRPLVPGPVTRLSFTFPRLWPGNGQRRNSRPVCVNYPLGVWPQQPLLEPTLKHLALKQSTLHLIIWHWNNLLYSYYTTCHLITTMFVSWLIHYCFDALLHFMVNKHVDHPVLSWVMWRNGLVILWHYGSGRHLLVVLGTNSNHVPTADDVYNQCACLPRVSVHSSIVGHIPIVIQSKFLFPALPPVISSFFFLHTCCFYLNVALKQSTLLLLHYLPLNYYYVCIMVDTLLFWCIVAFYGK